MEPKIIFEDDSFLVIDKPSGWVVNDAETTKETLTVQTWLRQKFCFPIFNNREMRNGIVHRIDKETSGILLVAKTELSFTELQRQFKERIVKKTYLALVHGKLRPTEGEINAPIGRLSWNRERFGVTLDGRDSLTRYNVIRDLQKNVEEYTLVEVFPQTGRTHQIRVHLQYLGYPLVGDEFYAGRKTARNDREWCARVFLHAAKISFIHPVTKKPIDFESPLASDLKNALEFLNSGK